jgi:hypothetical protein
MYNYIISLSLSLPPSVVRINAQSNILSDIYSDAGMEGQMLEP